MKLLLIIFLAISIHINVEGRERYVEKDFGNFLLHSDFVENQAYSDGEIFFYVLRTDNGKIGFVNNISIVQGKNKYSMADHEMFRDVILKQLAWQYQNDDTQIYGDGRMSPNGYIVYTFKCVNNEKLITYYYIINKDNNYIKIQETTRGVSKITDEAAMMMVNTFLN